MREWRAKEGEEKEGKTRKQEEKVKEREREGGKGEGRRKGREKGDSRILTTTRYFVSKGLQK